MHQHSAIAKSGPLQSLTFFKQSNLIAGEWVQADSGLTIDVVNPATRSIIGTVPRSGKDEASRAIEAAHRSFSTWRRTTALERAKLLHKLHDAILANLDDLATLLTIEQGKPLGEAKGEIAISAAYIRWFAEEGRRTYGDIVPSPWTDRRILVTKEPVGVVAAITPWNFPSSMLARKLGPALAAGCTVVVKPASQTPYSALAWGILLQQVGFPDGVVNIVTGSASEIGDEICSNPLVRKVSFTGSTEVGKLLLAKCASSVKKVSLELGGNAPFIVFDDTDIEKAVEGAILAKYRNMGQTCVCANRFIVQAGIHDAFVERLATASSSLVLGDGLEANVQQGPLIDEKAVEKVEILISDAIKKGGKIVAGGRRHSLGSTFFEPTVIVNVTPEMNIAQEEIFGPVAPIFRFTRQEDALALANDGTSGLASYCFTSDLARAFRMMEGLKFGMVGINEGLITTVEAPFGGVNESGLGKEGGSQGIQDYLDIKYVCVGGIRDARD